METVRAVPSVMSDKISVPITPALLRLLVLQPVFGKAKRPRLVWRPDLTKEKAHLCRKKASKEKLTKE